MAYMAQWPESFIGKYSLEHVLMMQLKDSRSQYLLLVSLLSVAEAPDKSLMGYVLGKAEGEGKLWHGHVSAVTVAPEYRRLGLAKTLMDYFEDVSVNTYNAFFVDLFVRASNKLAINMYEKFGYIPYRQVLGYYSGELPEDALDMRKALPR
jgi:N-terminal acetyltransferase B complex catalytic subunit